MTHKNSLQDLAEEWDDRLANLTVPFRQLQSDLDVLKNTTNALFEAEKDKIERRTTLLMLGLLVAGVGYINLVHPLVKNTTKATSKAVETTLDALAPDFSRTPQKGEPIPGTPYRVTSPWGPRNTGIPGASTYHRGVDADTPIGTQLYAIGKPGQEVNVRCWRDGRGGGLVASYSVGNVGFDYLHLSRCQSGKSKAGQVIALSGDSGVGAAHFHLTQRNGKGEKVPPEMGYLIWSLTGRKPEPVVSRTTEKNKK